MILYFFYDEIFLLFILSSEGGILKARHKGFRLSLSVK